MGITDGLHLDEAMNDYASAAWAAISIQPSPAVFDFKYPQHIHFMMFGRLFEWSGQIRDVNTVAGNTGIIYARPEFIDSDLADMFRILAEDESLLSTEDPGEFAT